MMNRSGLIFGSVLLMALAVISCSGQGDANKNPVTGPLPETSATAAQAVKTQTHLWGYYDVFIDIANNKVGAIVNRQAMFTANVVTFLNSKPANLGFNIKETIVGVSYIDVDIDVTITHPFPGLTQYNGYDVRGIFMGNGSSIMAYNGDLSYSDLENDQSMIPDPDDGFGGPDGYTRWFNYSEFSEGGMALLQYTKGKFASAGYVPTATLNPYKYFADGLGATQDVWTWLISPESDNGVFSAGSSNIRNYYLRFPNATGVKFAYAVIANWEGEAPQYHPSNTPEAVGCELVDSSHLFYENPSFKGGNLTLDVSLFGWKSKPSKLYLESTVLSSVHQFTLSEMSPIGGGEHYSTYHVDIVADQINGTASNELWIIAQYDGLNYNNDFGVPNLAGDDPLAALFRFPVTVASQAMSWINIESPNGGEKLQIHGGCLVQWDSYLVPGNVNIDYSKDHFVADIHTIATNVPNSGVYAWQDIPNDPTDKARLRITSVDKPSVFDISDSDFSILPGTGWARTWGGMTYDRGYAVGTDDFDNVYVAGSYGQTVDFNPDPLVDELHTSIDGLYDPYISKFDGAGNFEWVITWGGASGDEAYGMAVDGAGNCYVTGWFQLTCDFDPDPVGVEERTTNGGGDMFLAKYDTDGNLVWVRTWGSVYEDYGQAVALDGSGNVYVTGAFYRSIADIDFDPGPGTDYHNAVGSYDVCLSKFDSDGNFLWAWTWGGVGEDWAYGIAATATGDVFVTGPFLESVDFNPDPVEQDIYNAGSDFDNVFVTKYNTAGVYQWTRVWDGGGRDNGRAAATDAAGNVYIVGDYGAPFNIGSFLRKYSPGGVLQYGYTWGSTDSDFAYGVATDGLGYLYVTGSFRYTVDFDPSGKTAFATSVGMEDIYLVKFSEGGVFQWVCSWGSWLYDEGLCVAADHSGNAYTSGYYYAETDFDPGPGVDIHTNVNWRDAFLSKILPQGSW